jgi:hypothetical protein
VKCADPKCSLASVAWGLCAAHYRMRVCKPITLARINRGKPWATYPPYAGPLDEFEAVVAAQAQQAAELAREVFAT